MKCICKRCQNLQHTAPTLVWIIENNAKANDNYPHLKVCTINNRFQGSQVQQPVNEQSKIWSRIKRSFLFLCIFLDESYCHCQNLSNTIYTIQTIILVFTFLYRQKFYYLNFCMDFGLTLDKRKTLFDPCSISNQINKILFIKL